MAFHKKKILQEKFNIGGERMAAAVLRILERDNSNSMGEGAGSGIKEPEKEDYREDNEAEHIAIDAKKAVVKIYSEPDYNEEYEKKIIKKYPSLYIKGREINLCIYRIVVERTRPFLQFLLCNEAGKAFKMPTIRQDFTSMKDLVYYAGKKFKNIGEADAEIEYSGIIANENALVFTMAVANYEVSLPEIPALNQPKPKKLNWCWVLPTEIMNDKYVLDIPVEETVPAFFNRNPALLYLSLNAVNYESPMAAYSIVAEAAMAYQSAFGAERAASSGPYGPYYMFGSYKQTIMELRAKRHNNQKENLVILRSAVFPGKVKVNVNVKIDLEQAIDWVDHYDSFFFVGPATTEVGYIVKWRAQHFPLSYHVD